LEDAIPDTRNSLILRLPDRQDIEAWDRFAAIYEPVVFRLALAKGLQEADARDLVQEVLLSVSRAVERWEPDAERGRFRDWLFRIARNLIINFLTRAKHRRWGQGGSDHVQMLNEQSAPDADMSAEFDLELRREMFCFAAERVQQEVQARTWEAFRLTYIDGRTVEDAALQLGVNTGVVQVARCRVLARLRETVRKMESRDA
jgi:RNA polymerase sigma-70 factor (ECF subfamily)